MPGWLAVALVLAFLYFIRDAVAPFVVAGVLAYILVPVVEAVCKRFRAPRGVVVLLLYAALVVAGAAFFLALEPMVARETQELVQNSPAILESLFTQTLGSEQVQLLGATVSARTVAAGLLAAARDALGRPTEALHVAEALVHGVFNVFLVLIVLFYLLLDWERLIAFAVRFVPAGHRERVGQLAARVHAILGRYVRGQVYLVILMAAVTWVVLSPVFHLRFALPIALATGMLEVIPLVGPVVAATVAASVALTQGGPQFALGVVIFYTIARQAEDQIVMPLVVGRAVHLHPVATVLAVLCGGALAGILGMVLAVPAAATIAVLVDEVWPEAHLPAYDTDRPDQANVQH